MTVPANKSKSEEVLKRQYSTTSLLYSKSEGEEDVNPSFKLTLYQRSPHPDNHTDPDYLSAMALNPNPTTYNYDDTMVLSTRIVLQMCACAVFLVMYYHLRAGCLHPRVVHLGSLLSTSIGYFFYKIYPVVKHPRRRNLQAAWAAIPREHVKVIVLYFIIAHQLSPVMRTLTLTVSTDTIHVTAIAMVFIHLFTCDYGMAGFLRSKTISANAAVIASISLASRVPTDFHSMALLTNAVEIFILFPIFSKCIWASDLTLVLSILIGSACTSTISSTAFLTYVGHVFAVIIVFPLIFILCIHYKNNIYGPWDEAQILKKKMQIRRTRRKSSLEAENDPQ